MLAPLAPEAKDLSGLQLLILTRPQNGLWGLLLPGLVLVVTGDVQARKYSNGSIIKHLACPDDHLELL